MKISFRLLVFLALSILLSSCAAPTIYDAAAQKGTQYQDAMVHYTNTSKSVNVAARAKLLAEDVLPLSDSEKRLTLYDARLTAMKQGIGNYDLVRAHAISMRTYFVQLQILASSNAPEETEAAIKETVGALNDVGNQLTSSTWVTEPVGTIVGELLAAGVRIYQRKLLAAELEENGVFIERQLILQQEAVHTMGRTLKADLGTASKAMENALALQVLDDPSGIDPTIWSNQVRDVVLIGPAMVGDAGAADVAKAASSSMLATWRALIKRAAGEGTLEDLTADLSGLASEVRELETATGTLANAFGV